MLDMTLVLGFLHPAEVLSGASMLQQGEDVTLPMADFFLMEWTLRGFTVAC